MEILGLPLHPLIVHAVVVLVPLAAVGGLAISALKWARRRYGSLVVAGAFAAAASTLVAQQAGEDLQRRVFRTPSAALQKHMDLGGTLLIWTILLFVGTAVVMVGQWLIDRQDTRGTVVLVAGIALTVVCAIVSVIQTVRIGHSGSVAVWGGVLP